MRVRSASAPPSQRSSVRRAISTSGSSGIFGFANWPASALSRAQRTEESSMADLGKKYTPKSFPHLKGLKGISDGLLESHFKLYEGYVNRTNKLTETLSGLAREGQAQ